MPRNLPSLNALRAFEAAAKHLSFTRAADELNVTQAAVSHQVKTLEEQLGLKLFKRLNRALMLTDEGQRYFPGVRDGLDQLAAATQDLLKVDHQGVLTVSVMPSFASLWLVQRISRFSQIHPDIDVRIAAEDALVDFDRDDVDLVVRYGYGNWPDLYKEKFMGEEIFPVCSVRYLQDHPELVQPSDIKDHMLLHDYAVKWAGFLTWEHWFEKAGVSHVDARRGPRFSHTHMVIQACMAGEGIALGRESLIADELKAGRLVKLFDISVQTDVGYYICCPPDAIERHKNKAFRDWIIAEAGAGTSA